MFLCFTKLKNFIRPQGTVSIYHARKENQSWFPTTFTEYKVFYNVRVKSRRVNYLAYRVAPSAKKHFWGHIIEYSVISVVTYFLYTYEI